MRYFTATGAALIIGATPLWAQCEVPDPTAAAAGWTLREADYEWYAESPDYPGLSAGIFMYAPERPRILDWVIPERYNGRIGVLQHYAGEPGTSYLVTIVTNVVIDLKSKKVLGEANFSEDCELVGWHWFDSVVVAEDSGNGETVIKLP